jgi:flagellar basal body-associated protein FliL
MYSKDFPELETLIGKPYGSSTKWILIVLLIFTIIIAVFYFLIAAGYIATYSPSSPNNPNNKKPQSSQNTPINSNTNTSYS